MGAISSLLANGPWILVGLVLLHLACLLQPRDGALNGRLATWRRLAALGAGLYLLVAPLPPLLTWRALAANQTGRDQVIRAGEAQMRGYRDALNQATSLVDLRARLARIPGSKPLPPQLDGVPFAVVRQQLLRQLDSQEPRFRARVRQLQEDANAWERWRKALQASFASLMLALGFACGAEGLRLPRLGKGLSLPRIGAPFLPKNATTLQLAQQRRLNRWLRKVFGKTRKPRANGAGLAGLLPRLGLGRLFGKALGRRAPSARRRSRVRLPR